MIRAKQRKLLQHLPHGMPEKYLEKALEQITNDLARQQVRVRYARREAAARRA